MAKKDNTAAAPSIKIVRWSLPLLYKILDVPLHGAQLRARNQFAKLVRDQLTNDEDIRVKMIEEVADKDPKTKETLKKEGGEEYQITADNLQKYRKQFDAYMKESWIIDLLPSVKPMLVAIRPLILESKIALSTVDGYAYEEIATAFEAL